MNIIKINSQTLKGDKLEFNSSANKKIEWFTSSYENGFGHKIYNSDPGGKTLLNIDARHNSNTWTNALTITSQGKIGVGTMDPAYLFQVNGTASFLNIVTINNKLGIGTNEPAAKLHLYESQELGSNLNDTKLLIRISGKCGVGNTVMNNIWLKRDFQGSDWLSTRLHNGISIDASYLSPGTDTRTWWERDPYNNIQSWGNGNKVYMTLKSGNLGLGTEETGPHRFAVEGSIGAREIQVEASGWSDFVFTNEYELMSLEETEQFILKNKHLPDIPKESEVLEKGINLGEMDAKLLQKIEELTLYIIEQNKLNQIQQVKIKQLENKLNSLKKK
ncbi:hypothetical protein [Saccharicrinis fermentans]|nr:hypothetical protein [Saccharicrinis fermentans]